MTDMPEHDFEKQVREVMDQLRLEPGGDRFPLILEQVRQRRKKKRRFLWLLLPFLLPVAGYLLFLQHSSRHPERAATPSSGSAAAALAPAPATGKPAPAEAMTAPAGAHSQQQSSTAPEINPPALSAAFSGDARRRAGMRKPARTRLQTTAGEEAGEEWTGSRSRRQQGIRASGTPEQPGIPPGEESTQPAPEQPESQRSSGTNRQPEQPGVTQPATPSAITPATAGLQQKPEPVIPSASRPDSNSLQPGNSRRINWYYRVELGMSAFGNRYLPADLQNADVNGSAFNPGSSTATASPAAVRRGISFSAGGGVLIPLSAKVRLGAGLEYRLLTGRMHAGSAEATTSGSAPVYLPGNRTEYTNKAHLLTLPVALELECFRAGRFPVSLQTGFSLSRMLSENLLQYSRSAGSYYHDSRFLNSTLLAFQLGFSVNLAREGKPGFRIGPEYWQSLTPAARAGLYARSPYRFFGIRLSRTLR